MRNTDAENTRSTDGEPTRADDAESSINNEDEGTTARNTESESPTRPDEDGQAYEEGSDIGNARVGDLGEAAVVDQLAAEGYTDVVQVQNNSGHGVDIIARNPLTGDVKAIEVKANSSRLSRAQREGGETYVDDRIQRALDVEGHYRTS